MGGGMIERPRVGISRCLLGEAVRHDGGHKLEPSLIAELGRIVQWVPICPEVEVGMGVPREPIQLVVSDSCAGVRLMAVRTGSDWTERMRAWALVRIEELRVLRLSGFVLKARSPSCGVHDVPVRGGAPGRGMFAAMLTAELANLPVEDEERLRDPVVRAHFVQRVMTSANAT